MEHDESTGPKRTEIVSQPAAGTRRAFLARSLVQTTSFGAALAGAAVWPFDARADPSAPNDPRAGAPASPPPPTTPVIRSRRALGQTGLTIPDIGMGTFSLERAEELVHYALDRGITHFDTAESYAGGRAEEVLGRALKGRRQQVTLASKFSAHADVTADRQMQILERSLRRLGTDHLDVYLNHAVNDVASLDSPEWQTFVARAKREGKIRAAGMSGHAGRLTECLAHGLDAGLLDVILVAYNFSQTPTYRDGVQRYFSGLSSSFDFVSPQPGLPALLARAHAQGVGVMVMKTLRGARLNDMRPFERPGRTFAQAAFRWVLSERAVDGLVVSMTSRAMIDEYVAASGSGPPGREDLALLARYEARHAATSCTPGCAACVSACPAGVPIPDIQRMRMYALDYEQPAIAAREYARLRVDATACLGCSGEPCAGACPVALTIAANNRDTHDRLA